VLPEAVTYLRGSGCHRATRTVTWQGALRPNGVPVRQIWVRVNHDAAAGTVIVNEATLTDGAGGGSASAETIVIKPPPHSKR
jgi:hypothetical protein